MRPLRIAILTYSLRPRGGVGRSDERPGVGKRGRLAGGVLRVIGGTAHVGDHERPF